MMASSMALVVPVPHYKPFQAACELQIGYGSADLFVGAISNRVFFLHPRNLARTVESDEILVDKHTVF